MRVAELLEAPEGHKLDFKRDLSSLAGVLKDIVAFANSAGGTVLVGVADDRSVVGVADPMAEEERLANAISDSIAPQISVDLRLSSHAGKALLLVDVPHQLGPVHLKAKGEEAGTYVRTGSTNRRADGPRLAELRRWRDRRSFDELPCTGAVREELDEALIEALFRARDAPFDEASLRTNRIVTMSGSELVPTNAGVILFGRPPRDPFPDARFRCITYPGPEKGTAADDPVDFDDRPLLGALEDVLGYVRTHTRRRREIEGTRRREVPEYSPAVLREVLVNAVAHADYNVIGSRLDVSVYSDRVVVQSPGSWPPGMSVDDLKAGISQVRNRAIAKTLNTLGFMEEQGTAWARVREAAAEGYPEPEWSEVGPVLRVVLRPRRAAAEARQPQLPEEVGVPRRRDRRPDIVAYLDEVGQPATVVEIAEAIGLRPRMTRTWLERLQAEGRVRATEGARHDPDRRYRLAGSGASEAAHELGG